MGCACHQCDYARSNPDYKDGMVVSLALVDEAEGKVSFGLLLLGNSRKGQRERGYHHSCVSVFFGVFLLKNDLHNPVWHDLYLWAAGKQSRYVV